MVIPGLILFFASAVLGAPIPLKDAVTVDAPPGWEDLTVQRRSPDIVAVFKGPQESSFVFTRLKPGGLANPAGKKALLLDVLSGINRRTGLVFMPKRELQAVTYKNDLTAYCIHADLDGKPRMIIAVAEYKGQFFLATLRSGVPDTMLPSILRTVQSGASEADRGLVRRGASVDSQIGFTLPDDVWLRTVAPREKSEGIVAVILGYDSVLSFKKLGESSASAGEEAALVKFVLKSASGVDPASISAVQALSTPAGPGILYASAKIKTSQAATQVAAGFLPWGYWGYALWASGPRARELVEGTAVSLGPGPAADPKVLAATPGLAGKWSLRSKLVTGLGILAGVLLAFVVLVRTFGGRKTRYVSSSEGG